MKEIVLTQGKLAQIDDSDFERVSRHCWTAIEKGKTWYAKTRIGEGYVYLHQFLLGDTSGLIDHWDQDGLNNQRANLRLATPSQNQANAPKREGDFSSPFKGVSWGKRDSKWEASINLQGKQFLGYFRFAHEAALAYDRAALRAWGDFSCLNFPRTLKGGRTTILMVGWGRSGKDAGAEILAELTGFRYGFSFSRAALPFMCEVLGQDEKTAWEERHNHRMTWKNHLDHLRRGDETLLAEMALCHGEILAGLRDIKELEAVRTKGLFSHILWVNRPGVPADPTTTFGPGDADEVIDNNGTLDEYKETLKRWAESKGLLK